MAIRRINFTARQRLRHSDVRITVSPGNNSPASFDADLHLRDYGLPEDALIFVEAYRQTAWMRFAFGTVGLIVAPETRTLTEFDSADAVLFRVRITSGTGKKGLLLAEADGLRPKMPDETTERRTPLLPVKSDRSLGEQVFRVDFSDRPILLVNHKAGDWRALARAPGFIALAYPSVLREILTRILTVEDYDDPEDKDDWRAQWLRFALQLGGVREIPDVDKDAPSDVDDWIEKVVFSYCHRVHNMKHFGKFWAGSEN